MAQLVVTVDTEEEGLWGGRYPRTGLSVDNIEGIPRFQEICERYGVRPTYLVDAAIVESDRAVAILEPLAREGRCEIGTHVHPWCNPPFEEPNDTYHSYLHNLSPELQYAKIEWLTERIAERFGERPRSFRAGRYGASGATIEALAKLGYLVDSSVTPFQDHSRDGGPDFRNACWTPYRVGRDDILRPVSEGLLWEVPVSVGYTVADFRAADRRRNWAMKSPWRRLKAVGILDRLGLARRVKFCPEQASATDLCRLVDAYLANDAPVMVMMLHSSSLTARTSPYTPDEAGLERLLATLESTLSYCTRERKMSPAILSETAETLGRHDSPTRILTR